MHAANNVDPSVTEVPLARFFRSGLTWWQRIDRKCRSRGCETSMAALSKLRASTSSLVAWQVDDGVMQYS